MGPARLAEMLLKINVLYEGEHELRILTADVREEQLPVYRMRVEYPSYFRFFGFLWRGWAFYRGIYRVKKEFDFDVVLFGNATSGLVSSFFLEDNFIGGFVNDDHTVAVKWNNWWQHEGGLSLFFQTFIEKRAIDSLDLIITCSDYLKHQLVKTYGSPKEKIYRLYQGIDLSQITFKPRQINLGKPVKILYVKWRFRLGGLDDLSTAVGLLTAFSFEVSILGPYWKDEDKVLNLFKGMPHVTAKFFGPVDQQTVHEKMDTHDILCIPSHLEAQGLANVEGMAHGINVVSSSAGGIPEVLDFGKNGWLCKPGDPVSLADALNKCLSESEDEKYALSLRARRFVERYFDGSVMLENLLEILKKNT